MNRAAIAMFGFGIILFLAYPVIITAEENASDDATAAEMRGLDSLGDSELEPADRSNDGYEPVYDWPTINYEPSADRGADSTSDYGNADFDKDYGDTERWYERGDWLDYDLKSEGDGFNSWYDE